MTQNDLRQLRLMSDLMRRSAIGMTDVSNLIAGLELLLESLESEAEEWKSAFRRQWGVLEIEYAVALDLGQTALSSDGISRISHAVNEMQYLLAQHVKKDDQPIDPRIIDHTRDVGDIIPGNST